MTQCRCLGAGRAYVDELWIASGNNKTAAIRLLRRRLSDEVFRRITHRRNPRSSEFPSGQYLEARGLT